MPNETLDLSTPWPFTAALTLGFLICLGLYMRQPERLKSAIPCIAFGLGLATTFDDHLRLDGAGATQRNLYETTALAWADVRDARFIERHGKSGPHHILELVGRNGETIDFHDVDEFGKADAAVIADFLRRRLPGPLGVSIAARLSAMQSGDTDWAYQITASPGA